MTIRTMKLSGAMVCLLLGCGSNGETERNATDGEGAPGSQDQDAAGSGGGDPSGADDAGDLPRAPDAGGDANGDADKNDGGQSPGNSDGAPALDDFVGSAGQAACVQAQHFLLGLTPDPANSKYAAPVLEVACTAAEVRVTSNNIPSFAYVQKTPNALVEMDMEYRFPRFPKLAAATTAIPLGGTVAVAVNGLSIFGPTEAPMMGYRDPYLDRLLDFCNGHTAPNGMYHFHARPDCLFKDAAGNVRLVMAYAFDGFPVLAPYACSSAGDCTKTRALKSSWQRAASQWNGDTPDYAGASRGSWDIHEYVEGSGDLDECNGLALPGGGYAYYATDTFPYFIGCYRGTPTANNHGH